MGLFLAKGRRVGRPFLILAALVVATASGCGPAKGKISGTVKYNGEPLPSGTITFLSDAGDKPTKGSPIAEGKYTISDFPAGPAKVTVVTTAPPTNSGTARPSALPIPPSAPIAPATQLTPPGKYVPIPKRYADPEKSGLSYEVKGGEQSKDFELTP